MNRVQSGFHFYSILRVIAATIAIGFVSGEPANAQTTYTWSGAGTTSNWTDVGNWGGTAPVSDLTNTGTLLVFTGTTQLTNTLDFDLSAYSLTFNSTAGAFVIGGTNSLTLGAGGITKNSTVAATINAPIILGAAQTWTNAGAGVLTIGGTVNNGGFALTVAGSVGTTISGILSGTGSLTKTGSGTLILSGTNTYSGGTTISGGTVTVAYNATGSTGLGTGPITFTANATLNTSGTSSTTSVTITNAISIPAGVAATLNSGFNGRFTGVVSGAGRVILTASSSLSATNTFTGGTTISGGQVGFGSDASFGAVPAAFSANNITITGGSYSSAVNGGAITQTPNVNRGILITGSAGFDPNGANITVNAVISGTGSLTRTAFTSTLLLNGLNTYTGTTNIPNGTDTINSIKSVGGGASALGAPTTVANGTITMGSTTTTGTLSYVGPGDVTDRVISLAGTTGGATLDQSGGGLLKYSATAFTATGRGSKTLTLQGSTFGVGEISGTIVNNSTVGSTGNTATFLAGATTITLASVDGIALGATITGTGIAAGTTITAIDPATKIVTLSAGTSAANTATGSTYTIPGVVNLTSVTKAGTGLWTLSGANTYTGATTVSAGALNLTGTLASAITVNANAYLTGTGSTTKTITLNDGAFITSVQSGSISLRGNGVTANLATTGVNVFVPLSLLVTGGIADVIGYGTGPAPAASSFYASAYRDGIATDDTANTKITLSVSAGQALTWATTTGTWDTNLTPNFLLAGGASNFFWGDAVTFDNATGGTVTITGTVAPSSVLVATTTTGGAYTFSGGSIAGPGSLTVQGPTGTTTTAGLTVNLTAANSYSGGTTIGAATGTSTATVNIAVGAALGIGTVTVNVGGRYTSGTAVTSAGAPFLRVNNTSATNFGNNIVLPSTQGVYAIQKGAVPTNTTGSNLTLSGVLSGGGTGVVLQFDSPTSGDATTNFTLSGVNTLAAGTSIRVNRGYIIVTNQASLGSASLTIIANSNTATGNLVFGNSFTLPNNVTIGTTGHAIGTNNFNGTLSGVLTSAVSFSKVGAGTLTLTNANAITAPFAVSTGIVAAGNAAALGSGVGVAVAVNTPNSVNVASGATLDLGGQSLIGRLIQIGGNGVGGFGALINSSATDASLVSGGLGTVYGTAAGGGISGGATVAITGGGGSGATATASLGVTASTFTIAGGDTVYSAAPTVAITGGGGSGATATAVLTAGLVTGITITAAGSGFTTAPTITFTGGTVTTAGTTTPSGTGNASNFLLVSTTLTNAGSGYTSAPTVSLSSGTATVVGRPVGVQLTANSSIGGSGNLTVPFVTGGFALTKVGTGNLTLSGTNNYTGATSISAGRMTLGASGALPTTTNVTLSGGTLAATAGTTNGTSGTLAMTASSTLDLGGSTGSVTSLTFADSSALAWTGSLTITGYTGPGASGSSTTTQLFVGASSSSLTPAQLAAISFSGYTVSGAAQLTTGEVVPLGTVPEPATILGLAAAGLGLGWIRRRQVATIRG